MRRIASISVAAMLLAGTACSAAPQQAAQPAQDTARQQPAAPTLPKDAPDTGIANVPATSGKANLAVTPPPFTVETIGQFQAPFAMAFLPGGQLLVTEKAGTLKLRNADGSVVAVGGVPKVATGGQGGLLDVAPAPDFATSRTIYLTYSEDGPNGSQLALARASLDTKSPATLIGATVIWRSGSPGPGGQFGATIAFAPDGKSLFLSSGERQRFSPAQDPDQALGKILHLTLDGGAAPGNPMASAGGVKAETWSTGHRNPYGLAFDAQGRLWEVEMGPRGGDELNQILPGKNYGWPVVSNGDNYSGKMIPDHPSKPEFEAPKLWWNPSISPGGMIIYSGDLFPQYKGSAFIAALSGQALIRVTLGDDPKPGDQWTMGTRIRDVAQAPDGSIWLLEDGEHGAGGKLLRLSPAK